MSTPRPTTWQIDPVLPAHSEPGTPAPQEIAAHTLDVVGGALVFKDENGVVMRAFAPAAWHEVTRMHPRREQRG